MKRYVKLSISLPAKLAAQIKKQSKREHVAVSAIVRRALESKL